MDINTVIVFIFVGIGIYIVSVQIGHTLERRKYLKMIEDLTDKVMSKNYQDYVFGQEVKKDDPNPVVHRDRSDAAEAVIEQANKEAASLEPTLKVMDGQLKDMADMPTG